MGYEKDKVIKGRFLLYEFIGTFLLCVSFNLEREYWGILLLAMIFSWDHSAGHFNTALTFGEFILRSKEAKDVLKGISSLFAIVIVQVLAATIAYALCLVIVNKEQYGMAKIYIPAVPTMCPNPGNIAAVGGNGCLLQYYGWSVFFSEFLGCLYAYGTYYVIRHTELPDGERKYMKFFGSICISMIFYGCRFMIDANSKGPINPTVAYSALIYGRTLYRFKDYNV